MSINSSSFNPKIRVLFYGTPEFARDILAALLVDPKVEIAMVVTQPDAIAGRGKKLAISPVKGLALEHKIPYVQPKNIKKAKVSRSKIEQLGPYDLAIVVAYGQIIPEDLLNLPKSGSLNIHVSLLPRWRGAAPVQRAILHGDQETGVCLMKMELGLDTGPVYCVEKFKIEKDDDAESIFAKSTTAAINLLNTNLEKIANGAVEPTLQPLNGITYAEKITNADLLINWNCPAEKIFNQIRAFSPKPGCLTFFEGKRLKIFSSEIWPKNSDSLKPGKLVKFDQATLLVECQDACLKINELQLEGKNKMKASDFLRGQKFWPEFLG